MSNYKSVRLEESVYQELIKWQHPRESLSEPLREVLSRLDYFSNHIIELAKRVEKEKGV